MGEPAFVPMTAAHLDWVAAREAELHAAPWSHGNFVDSLVAGHDAWLMQVDDVPVGYGVMLHGVDEAELLDIAVVREQQGRGHAGRLLAWLCERARAAGAQVCFLEVRASNAPAQALYARAGFAAVGRRRGYYATATPGAAREDAIVMRRAL